MTTPNPLFLPPNPGISNKLGHKSSKKLRHNARIAYMNCFMENRHLTNMDNFPTIMQQALCFSLVNNEYLNSVFKDHSISFHLSNYDFLFGILPESRHYVIYFSRSMSTAGAFLRLAQREYIQFYIAKQDDEMDKENGKKWIKLCLDLKRNSCLKHIDIHAENTDNTLLYILFDLVYKKIKTIRIRVNWEKILFDTRLELNEMTFWGFKPNILNTMQIKSRQIRLNKDEDSLMEFSKLGVLKPNKWIEKLILKAQFDCYLKKDDVIEENSSTWKELLSTKYKTAILCLKKVNPNMELEFHNARQDPAQSIWLNLTDVDTCVVQIKQMIKNVKLFIDMVQGEEMKISKIEIEVPLKFDRWRYELPGKIVNELQLKDGKFSIDGFVWYNGVEIKFEFTGNIIYFL